MKRSISVLFACLLVSTAASAFEGQRTFMPANNLHLEELDGGITEAQFNSVIDRTIAIYGPIIAAHGATLNFSRLWNDNTVNASADQPSPSNWHVNMYGGLARRPEVTEDGFAMVVCHELGHHIAGFPYVQQWAANEGQSDMHATGACATQLFATNLELAAIANESVPDDMKAKCDANHSADSAREICYRALAAGKSLADLLGALGNTGPVNFDTPDTTVVTRTNNAHPKAQCRLDSYVAGAMCGASNWDYSLIPGKDLPNRNSIDAQNEAFSHSCVAGDGARPKCWFAELSSNPDPGAECPIANPTICALMCQIDPSQPWCNN